MYNLNANKVGVATDNLIMYSTLNTQVYDGFEVTGNIRREKLLLFGGFTTDRLTSTSCDGTSSTSGLSTRDNPQLAAILRPGAGDGGQPAGVFRTTVKASAAYSFPYDIQVSGTFYSIPGPPIAANYTGERRHRGPDDHRFNRRGEFHYRESRPAEQRVPRLPEPARHAHRQDVPVPNATASRDSWICSTS